MYVHGGFEHDSPNIPINTVSKIDSQRLFSAHPALMAKAAYKTAKGPAKDGKASDTVEKKKAAARAQTAYAMGEHQEFKVANQANIAMSINHGAGGQMDAPSEDFSLLVRKISIDKLQEEPKKLGPNVKAPAV